MMQKKHDIMIFLQNKIATPKNKYNFTERLLTYIKNIHRYIGTLRILNPELYFILFLDRYLPGKKQLKYIVTIILAHSIL